MHAIEEPSLAGAVNASAPAPVTNREFTAALGRALHRPAVLAVPPFALRLALGRQLADELLLGSLRVIPARLARQRLPVPGPHARRAPWRDAVGANRRGLPGQSGGRGQALDGGGQVVTPGKQGEDGDGHPVVDVTADVGAALLVGAVDDEGVDDLVGNGGQRRLAVPRRPGRPHLLEERSPAQPPVEIGVDGDVQIGGDADPSRRRGPAPASSVGQTKIRATICFPGPTSRTVVRTSSAESQLMMAPSDSRPARRSMPGRSAAT